MGSHHVDTRGSDCASAAGISTLPSPLGLNWRSCRPCARSPSTRLFFLSILSTTTDKRSAALAVGGEKISLSLVLG